MHGKPLGRSQDFLLHRTSFLPSPPPAPCAYIQPGGAAHPSWLYSSEILLKSQAPSTHVAPTTSQGLGAWA
ncbi:Interleukin-32 [Manis pentadactyla]|nr:Interleukin-32 [Manis pentadactyla]